MSFMRNSSELKQEKTETEAEDSLVKKILEAEREEFALYVCTLSPDKFKDFLGLAIKKPEVFRLFQALVKGECMPNRSWCRYGH